MIPDVAEYIRSQKLIKPGDAVYAAVSGGADSVCMLLVLHTLQETFRFSLRAVHVNHHLRGQASDADESFVVSLCKKLGIELECRDVDVSSVSSHASMEEAARILRYQVFDSLPGLVATAHTADDNAETVLMNLIRGTGLKGLCGIPAKRGKLIRPMLSVTRSRIEEFLASKNQEYCTDSTNLEDFARRNRIRHHVMPLLLEENPQFRNTVFRMTALLQEDEAYLSDQADSLLSEAAVDSGFDCHILTASHPCIRRRAIHRLLSSFSIPKLSMTHVDAVDDLVCSQSPSGCVHLPDGLVARRQYALLIVEQMHASGSIEPHVLSSGELFPVQGLVYALHYKLAPCDSFRNTKWQFAVAYKDDSPLSVRSRAQKDSMRLSGGTKTLKKIMIDQKIPVMIRDQLPVIYDERGILAVAGVGVNQDFAAKSNEKAWLITIEERKEETNNDPSL